MIELIGKYNKAKVFTDSIEVTAQAQVIELCNQPFIEGSKIRIMPDTHAGAGCVIGTTMTIQNKIVPNLVGVDIGCGMETIKIKETSIDLRELDRIAHECIPSGFETRKDEHDYVDMIDFADLECLKHVNLERTRLSVGTLGGGNHFIEADKDEEGNIYIVVHSGSRNLGKQVAEYYQDLGYKELAGTQKVKAELIARLRQEGREGEIQAELKKIKPLTTNKQLAYVEGENLFNYLHDMKIVQRYADLNRKAMVDDIVKLMGLTVAERFKTIHNYIDVDSMILRKGAISARDGEKAIIPMNMRDGSLICIGKGNPDWNYSAPHGAGRLMSRSKAKEVVSMDEFKESMLGIYTTSVSQSTIDESPMAYKPMHEIIDNIRDTVDIVDIVKPIYNFKAGE